VRKVEPDFNEDNNPVLPNTKIEIRDIVGAYTVLDMTPEEIASDYDHFSTNQIEEALKYAETPIEEVKDAEYRFKNGRMFEIARWFN
jgi:uncharacterized protein (DUF433 family)